MSKKKWFVGTGAAIGLCAAVVMLSNVFSAGSADKMAAEGKVQFSDVTESDWFYEDVAYVRDKNLMNGTDQTAFSPDAVTTRGMLVTVLWRMEGAPEATEEGFSDVTADAYYAGAVAWASENGIVNGYSETDFGPDDGITREQMAAVLYRYADYKKYDISAKADLQGFADYDEISEYARLPLAWANGEGIIAGTSSKTLTPKGEATRAQTAAMLRRFCESIAGPEEVVKEEAEITPTVKPVRIPGSAGGTSAAKPEKDAEDKGEGKTPEAEKPAEAIPETEGSTLPTIRVGSGTAKPGETIRIPVEVKNNPGILGMILTIGYDENVLQLESAENGEAVSGFLTLTPSKTLENGARFVWDGLDITPDAIKDGTVLMLEFTVSASAPDGKQIICMQYTPGDIIDGNLENVSPLLVQGYIEVKKEGA